MMNSNLIFSLLFLNAQKVEPSKALPAALVAGTIPGPVGLAVPFMVARGQAANDTSTDTDTGAGDDTDTVPKGGKTVVAVPNLVGDTEADATKTLRDHHLRPVVERVYVQDGGEEDSVVEQTPPAGKLVDLKSKVTITVCLGPAPEPKDDVLTLEKRIEREVADVRHEVADVLTVVQASTDRIIDAINKGNGAY